MLVQDRTLIDSVDVFSGLNPEGYVLVNSASSPEEIGLGELVKRLPAGHVKTVPATDLALKFIGRPLPAPPCWRLRRDDGHAEAGKHQLGLRSEIFR